MPDELGGVAGLPRLVEALRARGYDDDGVAKITHGNWLRVLERDVAAVGPLLRPRRRRPAPDAARRGRRGSPRRASPSTSAAGTGRDTAELLRRGWRVVAIDREPEAIDRLLAARRAGVGAARDARRRASRTPSGRRATS